MRCGAVLLAAGATDAVDVAVVSADDAEDAAFRLERGAGGLALVALQDPSLGTLSLDFERGSVGWRGGERARGERLVRACRAGAEPSPRIVDGTGGLGTDAWLLASAGAQVHVVEQHPVLRALLADALERAAAFAPRVCARLSLSGGDTRRGVGALAPDVLYLDPMYPPRRKRALGDRRLRFVGALLAADGFAGDDAAGLVRAGLAAAVPRVVLKVPRKVRLEGVPAPHHSLQGRSTRFDVWISPRVAAAH